MEHFPVLRARRDRRCNFDGRHPTGCSDHIVPLVLGRPYNERLGAGSTMIVTSRDARATQPIVPSPTSECLTVSPFQTSSAPMARCSCSVSA